MASMWKPTHPQHWSSAVAGLIIMRVFPKTSNIAREPLVVMINLINGNPYSKEASRPQKKQLLLLAPKEASSKEASPKEASSKEASPKEASSCFFWDEKKQLLLFGFLGFFL